MAAPIGLGAAFGTFLAAFGLYGWVALAQTESAAATAELGRVADTFLFLQQDISLEGRITIRALRQPGGYLRVEVRGACQRGVKQQIRNFLNTII